MTRKVLLRGASKPACTTRSRRCSGTQRLVPKQISTASVLQTWPQSTSPTADPPPAFDGALMQRAFLSKRIDYSKLPKPAYKLGDPVATREAWGVALAAIGNVDERIVALDADVKNSTFSDKFEKAHPDRFFEDFIAEQVMVGAAM